MTANYDEQSQLRTADGERLHVVGRFSEDHIGAVLLVHGLGEHCGRYEHVMQVFNRSGFSVFRFDLRGHGRSTGLRGHVDDYQLFLDDVSLVANHVQQRVPHQKIVLYGHSMGGGIIANWCLQRLDQHWRDHITGAVLSAPWFRLASPPAAWKYTLINALSKVAPRYQIQTQLRVEDICADEEAIENYHNDPLIHGQITFRTAIECDHAGRWALANAHLCPRPILAIHGTSDKITAFAATQNFCESVQDARFVALDHLIHEPHHDPRWREVLYHVTEWMLKCFDFSYAAS